MSDTTTTISRTTSDSYIPVPTWKLLVFRMGWRSLRAFLTLVFVSNNAIHWSSLSWMERAVILVGGLVAAGDVCDAFLDQTLARMQEGQRSHVVDTETRTVAQTPNV